MFDLSSQANSQHQAAPAVPGGQPAGDGDVIVHAMPEQFRSGRGSHSKQTGLLILLGGLFLLLLAGGAVYYFAFMSPAGESPADQPSAAAPAAVSPVTPAEQPAPPMIATETPALATTTEPAPTAIPVIQATTTEVAVVAALDSDRDGLTDDEEAVLGTDKGKEDSDGDGFGDLVELGRGYNPAGPGKLVSNSQFKVAKEAGFYLLYPASWTQKRAGGDFALIWQAPDNQLIQLNREKLPQATTISAWYRDRFGTATVPPEQLVQKKADAGNIEWSGIKTQDGLVIYLLDPSGTEVITLSYSPGVEASLKYAKLFEAMALSLSFE